MTDYVCDPFLDEMMSLIRVKREALAHLRRFEKSLREGSVEVRIRDAERQVLVLTRALAMYSVESQIATINEAA